MAGKINQELARRIEESKQMDPPGEIPVIVHTALGFDASLLEKKGLKIRLKADAENKSFYMGTINAAQLADVADLDQVLEIEYDGAFSIL